VRLLLIRHGQSEGNAAGVLQGHIDYGLSGLGRHQAEATGHSLRGEGVTRVLTSPLVRAADTAAIIASHVGVDWEVEPALTEYDLGEVAGLTGPELRERFPEIVAAYQSGRRPVFPGEEGREPFYGRLSGLLSTLAGEDATIAAIGHGGVIGALCYAVTGADYTRPGLFQVANCSVTEVITDRGGAFVLKRHNDTCHLRHLSALD